MKKQFKKCPRCKETKEVSKFSKDKSNTSGFQFNCKACQKEYKKQNKERIKEYQKGYASSEAGRTACKKYKGTKKGKKSQSLSQKNKNEKYLTKFGRTHDYIMNLGRKANPVEKPCIVCGSMENLERHHPSYLKPSHIQWLCRPCHKDVHKVLKAIEAVSNETA